MRFLSTRGRAPAVSFREALFAGLAPDGGLYVPERVDPVPLDGLRGVPAAELGAVLAAPFIGDEIPPASLADLFAGALDFPIPIVALDEHTSVVELFHGPTFAFKDIGARVMARLMAHFAGPDERLTVLVATSGDTGGAVAQAFFGLRGTRVVVLFPDGGVTPVQAAQFTTLGGNVQALAVAGSFDDCQRLVKEAFADDGLRRAARLTSANSINIGRLLPQMIYYAQAALGSDGRLVVSVPSGNFGNITAGIWARALGVPVARFVAATTINDTVPRYLASGRYEARPSVPTLANAMDVGDPSNVERLRWWFQDDVAAMRALVTASVHTDADVRTAIRELWDRHRYVADPHSAIAYLGAAAGGAREHRVFLATAHPAKFRETVEEVLDQPVPLPAPLAEALRKPSQVEHIAPALSELRGRLL